MRSSTSGGSSMRYLVVHTRHEGCYDPPLSDAVGPNSSFHSVTINAPRVFSFYTREEAQLFFDEYINDMDTLDPVCRRDDGTVEHAAHCSCGILELDDTNHPVVYVNRRNQVFLMAHDASPRMYIPPFTVRESIDNYNLLKGLMRRCRSLSCEQLQRYIELGRFCEESQAMIRSTVPEETGSLMEESVDLPRHAVELYEQQMAEAALAAGEPDVNQKPFATVSFSLDDKHQKILERHQQRMKDPSASPDPLLEDELKELQEHVQNQMQAQLKAQIDQHIQTQAQSMKLNDRKQLIFEQLQQQYLQHQIQAALSSAFGKDGPLSAFGPMMGSSVEQLPEGSVPAVRVIGSAPPMFRMPDVTTSSAVVEEEIDNTPPPPPIKKKRVTKKKLVPAK